ncbi:MAG: hypothetical protein WBD36_06355 [Bacteroidota bacterium]
MKLLSVTLLSASLSLFPGLFNPQSVQDKENPTKSFSVKKGGTLVVDVEPGNIEINVWDKDEVFIEAQDIDERYPERLKMEQSGNTVRVEYRDRRRHTRDLLFTIRVPSEFSCDLKTSGGNIEERGKLKGSFAVNTKGGNVEVEELVGNLNIQSNGGNITTTKIDGDGEIKTNGGNVTVKDATGTLRLQSGGGNIRVDQVGKDLKLTTGGGNVTLGDLKAESEVRTGGGNLKVGKVQSKLKLTSGGGNVEVKGASDQVTVQTGGGNVTLEDIRGAVDLRTGGGDVRVELLPAGKGGSNLFSGGGDITLSVPENARVTIDARVRMKEGWGRSHKRIDIRSDYQAKTYQKDDEAEEITASYVLNGGGESISVETSNGVIAIRKLR